MQTVGLNLAVKELFSFLTSKPMFLLKPLKSFAPSNFGVFPSSFIILVRKLSCAPQSGLRNMSPWVGGKAPLALILHCL